MQTVHAVVECAVQDTFRVKQVAGMFDLPLDAGSWSSFSVEIPSLEDVWNIGVIVGPSGSGKTTIAKKAFGDRLVDRWEWPLNRSVLDGFPADMGIREITQLLGSVGFSSPPAWLRPFRLLSNGEQFRVHLARTLAERPDLAVIDEFTSVVDRTVARIGSAAIGRAVRRFNRRLVAVSCHYDILHGLSRTGFWIWGALSRGQVTGEQEMGTEENPVICSAVTYRFRRPQIEPGNRPMRVPRRGSYSAVITI